jgi:hypothetical protein
MAANRRARARIRARARQDRAGARRPSFAAFRAPAPQALRAAAVPSDATLSAVTQAPRIRPRYALFVDASADKTLRLVEARIEVSKAIRGWIAAPYAELRLPEGERFTWSPRMSLYVEDTPGGTNLLCRLQPEPEVWTAYMASWGVVAVAALGVTMYGISQWVVSGMPWVMLVGLPLVGAAAGLLYLAALVGQRRCAAQTWLLERELQAALDGHGPRLLDDPLDDRPKARGFR